MTNDSLINSILEAVPVDKRDTARNNLPYIIDALRSEGILSPNVLAYAMATIMHETAGTFAPIREIGGSQQAVKLGYSGGKDYYGRGFIQLTHDYNYREIGRRIGLGDELVKNPDLALDPKVSAKILAAFFKDKGVSDLAEKGKFIEARKPVNSDDKGRTLAKMTQNFLKPLKESIPQQWQESAQPAKLDLSSSYSAPSATLMPQSTSRPLTSRIVRPVQAADSEPRPVFTPQTNATSPQTHNVRSGETLWGIAQKQLGEGSRWKELGYQGEPTRLPVGTKLKIPVPSVAGRY
jgi:predicted chitinase/LysM repeat protein